MSRLGLCGLLLALLGACSQGSTPPESPRIGKVAALGRLMKNEVNPAFSKITFLVFHGDTLEEDPATIKAELQRTAASLRNALDRLNQFKNPPVESPQGREVFFTYANTVAQASQRLVAAIDSGDGWAAQAALRRIADACNSCHHFFRLKIEDSVVPSSTTSQLVGEAAGGASPTAVVGAP